MVNTDIKETSGTSATRELETWFTCPVHGRIKYLTNMSDRHPWKCPACGEQLTQITINVYGG